MNPVADLLGRVAGVALRLALGLAAAVFLVSLLLASVLAVAGMSLWALLTGRRPAAYHADHSRPERPVARTLAEEISRVMRARVVNPKWIAGVKRHGYKGAFEIIATVDYMFAFAATTGAVKTHHFDLAFEAFVEDGATRDFLKANNRFGYEELIAKFNEAQARGYWQPRSNRAALWLEEQ